MKNTTKHILPNRPIISWWILIFFTGGFYTTTLFASPDYWPTNGWRSSTLEEQGMDSEKLIEMMELIRDKDYAIDSVTIIRNGYLVTDAYLYPFRKNTKHMINSAQKSINSALVGIALDKGYIKSIHQPILEFFPEKTIAHLDEQKRAITLGNLLTMTSGLDTKDSMHPDLEGLKLMFRSEDWVQYVLDLPMVQMPGKHFKYSNAVSYLLSAIIQKVTKTRALEFPRKHLFEPLGITDFKWLFRPRGIDVGWGELMLTPLDMAKFGLLYLNKGRWDDEQVVSSSWVEASTRKHFSGHVFDGYGYQWWTGSAPLNLDLLWRLTWSWRHVDSAPSYFAFGYLGQFIFIVPEKNMVVVFTGNVEGIDHFIPKGLLDEYIIPAAVSSQAIDSQPKKKEHLDSLLENLAKAPTQGAIWTSEENGVAKKGEFIRTASPAFSFKYPKISFKQKNKFDGQVMYMKTLVEGYFSAFIRDIPKDTQLAEVGPKMIGSFLEDKADGSNIQIFSNKKITLGDGTAAYRTDINWQFQSTYRMKTFLVSAYKDKKWVSLSYSFFVVYYATSTSEDMNEGTSIVESLIFK